MPQTNTPDDQVLKDVPRMGLDDCFQFRCGPDVDCFNQCCRDVSILLTPYDVLRMKRALRIDSSEFLERYTFPMQSQDKQIPVVFLKMQSEGGKCPFVTERGCSIYQHRPWACRMYPLGMAEPETPDCAARRFYFLIQEEVCHGHGRGGTSVRQWIDDQQIEAFEAMQSSFRRLMFHPGWQKADTLTPEKLSMLYMALYDLDRFRRFVFETKFLELFEIDEARIDAIRSDDEELLEFALDWLAFALFHEKRMKLKKRPTETEIPEEAGQTQTVVHG